MSNWSLLHEMTIASVLFRLALAMLLGGLIGFERGIRHKAAGFRTYTLVCLGAALTMLLGQYQSSMLAHNWAQTAAEVGVQGDLSRFSAQVINGIGFLGAGTIIVTGRQEVKGLTTAAALWTSASMGLAIGAGYYGCIALGFILIFLCVGPLNWCESHLVQRSRCMNLYVEFDSIDEIRAISSCLQRQGVHIYDIDIDRENGKWSPRLNAVLTLRINGKASHAQIIHRLFSGTNINRVNEI